MNKYIVALAIILAVVSAKHLRGQNSPASGSGSHGPAHSGSQGSHGSHPEPEHPPIEMDGEIDPDWADLNKRDGEIIG